MIDIEVIKNIKDMQSRSNDLISKGQKIAFVPTMGYLHDGHLSLLREGKKRGDYLILSIFVNPTQFAEGEDLDNYPSNIEKDMALAEKEGVDALFLPSKDSFYPDGYQTYVELEDLPNHLCGISRPEHFRGVTTIVSKLFNVVKPNFAVFGQKDFQQLAIIRRMTRDLNFDIEIIGAPIVREEDGLAMSSRNSYLTQEQRKTALCLSESLRYADEKVRSGENKASVILEKAKEIINSKSGTEIDYLSLCDPDTLQEISVIEKPVLFALAVKVGNTRLIDNRILTP